MGHYITLCCDKCNRELMRTWDGFAGETVCDDCQEKQITITRLELESIIASLKVVVKDCDEIAATPICGHCCVDTAAVLEDLRERVDSIRDVMQERLDG